MTQTETTTKQCPFCAETIQSAAIVCRYCGRDLSPPTPVVPHRVQEGDTWKCSECGGAVRADAPLCKHCKITFGVPPRETLAVPIQQWQPSRKIALWAVGGIGFFVLVAIVVALATGGRSYTPAPVRTVTMDGTDISGGPPIDPINLWDNYQTRSRVTGRAHDKESATLLQQSGAGCEVQTAAGQRGWVTCRNFIKEFK